MIADNPWLALASYEEKHAARFKGREKETEDVFTRLQQNDAVVCYAASGNGKTSLINAGLYPRLRQKGYFPVRILFTTEELTSASVDIERIVRQRIQDEISRQEESLNERFKEPETLKIYYERLPEYRDLPESGRLWWEFRTKTIQIPFGEFDFIPVLVFDQFEELFRAEWKDQFFRWVEDILKETCPTELSIGNDPSIRGISGKKLFKLLFSMRLEYVGELDYWSSQRHFIPQLMRNRYYLRALSPEAAVDIIQKQSEERNPISKKMRESAGMIVNYILSGDKKNDSKEIPPIILSLICHILYEEWETVPSLPLEALDLNKLIYGFYRGQMRECGMTDDDRIVMEKVLISSAGDRLRMPLEDQRLSSIHMEAYMDSEKGYSIVDDAHILRRDSINGSIYVELIHDRLADAISRHRESLKATRNKVSRTQVRRLLLWCCFAMLIIGCAHDLYLASYSLRPKVNGMEDNAELVEKSIIVGKDVFKSVSPPHAIIQAIMASSLDQATSLQFDNSLHYNRKKYICRDNVACIDSSITYYAGNATSLTFGYHRTDSLNLSFMNNTQSVYLLYPSDVQSIHCANSQTRVYIPWRTFESYVSDPIFSGLHLTEMGFVATLWKKWKADIRQIGVFFPICGGVWVGVYGFLLCLFILFSFSLACIYVKHRNRLTINYVIALVGLYSCFTLAFLTRPFSKWYGIPSLSIVFMFDILMVLLLFSTIILLLLSAPKRDKSISKKISIVYSSKEGKADAVELKNWMVKQGIEESRINLDYSLFVQGYLDVPKVEQVLVSSTHCIAVINEKDYDNESNHIAFWKLLPKSHHLHPIYVGKSWTPILSLLTVKAFPNFLLALGVLRSEFTIYYQQLSDLTAIQTKRFFHSLRRRFSPLFVCYLFGFIVFMILCFIFFPIK